MELDLKLIINIIIALFVYNIILRAIAGVFINQFMKSDTMKKEKKSFQDKLKDKLDQK